MRIKQYFLSFLQGVRKLPALHKRLSYRRVGMDIEHHPAFVYPAHHTGGISVSTIFEENILVSPHPVTIILQDGHHLPHKLPIRTGIRNEYIILIFIFVNEFIHSIFCFKGLYPKLL